MAKVILNAVRILSIDELCSVALARSPISIEPELAKSIGVLEGDSPLDKKVIPQSCKLYDFGLQSDRDLVVDRMICCTVLQKAIRRQIQLSPKLISVIVDTLNMGSYCGKSQTDTSPLNGASRSSTTDVIKPLFDITKSTKDGIEDEFFSKMQKNFDVSVDELKVLIRGQIESFSVVSVLGLLLKSLSDLSDCAFGMICEALSIEAEFLSAPKVQKLYSCSESVRNLGWLTEDSKIIPKKGGEVQDKCLIASYIVSNGEVRDLSASMLKMASGMLSVICEDATSSDFQSVTDNIWSTLLQTRVKSLCHCLVTAIETYLDVVPPLIHTLKRLCDEMKLDLDSTASTEITSKDVESSVKGFVGLFEDFKQKMAKLEADKYSLLDLEALTSLYSDLIIMTISLVFTTLSGKLFMIYKRHEGKMETKQVDAAGKEKSLLGHGNLLFNSFIKGLIGEESSMDGLKIFSEIHDTLGGYKILNHRIKIESILSPRNQRLRKAKLPKGTVDFSPDEMLVRSVVMAGIRGIFRQHGAVEIDTPVFELRETLLGKYGDDQKLIFDLKDHGGEQLSLRYDLTVPLARFLACNKIEKIKCFHIGKVYRRDEPQLSKGRYREFLQCDLDYPGSYPRMVADAEVIFILIRVLRMFKDKQFVVRIGHRVILDSIMSHCGVIPEMYRTICSSIDKLDKEPWERVKDEMVLEKGLSESVANSIKAFVDFSGSFGEVIKFLSEKNIEGSADALDDISILYTYLKSVGVEDSEISFDLSLARGLDYYTGVIFEAVLTGESVGSVGAGGRYDNLIGNISGIYTPSVGMSVGMERIVKTLNVGSVSPNITDVFVCTIGDSDLSERMKICSLLWEHGIRTEFHYSKTASLRKQLDTAIDKQISIVVIVGDTELEQKTVKLKLLSFDSERKSQEQMVEREKMVEKIKQLLPEHSKWDKLAAQIFKHQFKSL